MILLAGSTSVVMPSIEDTDEPIFELIPSETTKSGHYFDVKQMPYKLDGLPAGPTSVHSAIHCAVLFDANDYAVDAFVYYPDEKLCWSLNFASLDTVAYADSNTYFKVGKIRRETAFGVCMLMSCNVRKTFFGYVRPTKFQIMRSLV